MALPQDAEVDGVDGFDTAQGIDAWIVPGRRALVARYGVDVGAEAAAEAATWAVEHTARLATMANPAGYLYRVGHTAATRAVRWSRRQVRFPADQLAAESLLPDVDLFRALEQLRGDHRTAVLLVHGYGFTYREVAELLGVSEAAVTNFVHRGMTKLRSILGDDQT